jgi:alkylation response protein AidB-like acyl-CoA dehydrogenase
MTNGGTAPDAAELEMLLATARTFVREVLVPLESQLLHGAWAQNEPVLAQLREQARALGLWAPFLPASLGGRNLPLDAYARLSEVLGWTPFGHYACNCQAPDVGNMELLLQFGTDEQQAQFLEPLARGEIRSCFAMTEPEYAGSNPVQMSTHAVREGDELVITGHKWFTSSADGASFAVVMAVTDPDEAPPVPEQPVSKPGDLWILGDHRVLCGDSTVMTDVENLMGGQLPVRRNTWRIRIAARGAQAIREFPALGLEFRLSDFHTDERLKPLNQR